MNFNEHVYATEERIELVYAVGTPYKLERSYENLLNYNADAVHEESTYCYNDEHDGSYYDTYVTLSFA